MTEYDEQAKVIEHLNSIKPSVLFTVAKVGKSAGFGNNLRFKQLGYTAGTPDIIVLLPNKTYHGLLIELKQLHGGIQSKAQKKFQSNAMAARYAYALCHGSVAAIDTVNAYLNNTWPLPAPIKTTFTCPATLSRIALEAQELKDILP